MHAEIYDFISEVKKKYPAHFISKAVLECGSLNINGTVREHFHNCNYTGLDIIDGKDVDVVIQAHCYFRIDMFDVCISCEMLEHDQHWKQSLERMLMNLKSGGLMLITCAAPNRAEHGTDAHTPQDSPATNDYYHNLSIEEIESALPREQFAEYHIEIIREGMDLLFYGIKK